MNISQHFGVFPSRPRNARKKNIRLILWRYQSIYVKYSGFRTARSSRELVQKRHRLRGDRTKNGPKFGAFFWIRVEMTKNRSHTQRDSVTKVRDITLNPTQLYIICRPLSNKIKQKEIEQELFQLELSLVNKKTMNVLMRDLPIQCRDTDPWVQLITVPSASK